MGNFLSTQPRKQYTEPEMAAIKQLVEQLIKENLVVVFSKSYCPYCVKAKNLLSTLSIPFKAVELDTMSDGPAIQDYLLSKTHQRTVPNIFIKEKHIGGCDDLHSINRDQLKKMAM